MEAEHKKIAFIGAPGKPIDPEKVFKQIQSAIIHNGLVETNKITKKG